MTLIPASRSRCAASGMVRNACTDAMRQTLRSAPIGVKRQCRLLAHLCAHRAANVFNMNNTGERRAPGWVPEINTFGARLALVRQAMGWGNVAEAAKECGVPIASWRNWERDGREPRGLLNVAMKIAGVTGVDLDWLLRGPVGTTPAAAVVHTRQYATAQRVLTTIVPGDARADAHPSRSVRTRPIDNVLSSQRVGG